MLYIVATPIGDTAEITLRALEILKTCDLLICESTKESSKLLKKYEIKSPGYEVLDEHSTTEDLVRLLDLCRTQTVALVSDCGTPGFCDPGNHLIDLCRKNKIPVRSVLGASSLMGLLSLSSQKINQFYFRGFLPAENEARTKEWNLIKNNKQAIVIMDTPYRLRKTLTELTQYFSQRDILLVMNLSQPEEEILEGRPSFVVQNLRFEKAEFMILIYPA